MSLSEEWRPRRMLLAYVALALVITLSRIPGVVAARSSVLFNDDELFMTLTVLDRFLGVPPAFLSWPGGTAQLLGLPIVICELFFRMLPTLSANNFVLQLSELYRSPWNTLLLLRLEAVFISSFGLASLLGPFARLGVKLPAAILTIVCLASLPLLWCQSQMATPDAIGLGLACFSLAALSFKKTRPRHILLAGALAGLSVAAKLTMIPLIPLQLAFALNRSRNWKTTIYFILSLGIGFLMGLPYVWTDPIRLAKSVLANAGRQGNPMGVVASLGHAAMVVSPAILILALIGLICLCRRRYLVLVGSAIAGVLFVVMTTARAGIVYDRYYLVLAIICSLFAAVGLQFLTNGLSSLRPRLALGILVVSALAFVAFNTASYGRILSRASQSQRKLDILITQIEALDSKFTVIVPHGDALFLERLAGFASSSSLENLGRHVSVGPDAVAEFAANSGFPVDAGRALAWTLNNQEQILSAHLDVWAFSGNRMGIGLVVYASDPLSCRRFGFLTQQQAIDLFSESKDAVLVMDSAGASRANLPAPEVFGEYRLWPKGDAALSAKEKVSESSQ